MNTPRVLFLSLLVWPAIGHLALAQEKPPAIELSYPGHPEEPATVRNSTTMTMASTPIHVVGGVPLTFDLAVQAPLGSRLQIFADVIQTTGGSLAAPARRHVSTGPEIDFGQRTFAVVPCTLPELPVVRARTRFALTLRTEPKNPDLPDGLSVAIFVYPREEPGSWKKTMAAELGGSGMRRLAVFGGSPSPRQFLRERGIPFDDLGADWPAEPDTHTLYLAEIIGERPDGVPLALPRQFTDQPGIQLILFGPNIAGSMPAGVYQSADGAGGKVWKVTVPGPFEQADRHPRKLEFLSELFHQALTSHPRTPTEESNAPIP